MDTTDINCNTTTNNSINNEISSPPKKTRLMAITGPQGRPIYHRYPVDDIGNTVFDNLNSNITNLKTRANVTLSCEGYIEEYPQSSIPTKFQKLIMEFSKKGYNRLQKGIHNDDNNETSTIRPFGSLEEYQIVDESNCIYEDVVNGEKFLNDQIRFETADHQNEWQKFIYSNCQQNYVTAKRAVEKAYKEDLDQAKDSFNLVDRKIRQIRARKREKNQDVNMIPEHILREWMESKVKLELLKSETINKPLYLPFNATSSVRKISDGEYGVIITNTDGAKMEKKVTRQFMDEHFLQEYIDSVDQLYIQAEWIDIDPKSKSVSLQNQDFIKANHTCKQKYLKDDNARNCIKWIRITAIYGMKKRKLV